MNFEDFEDGIYEIWGRRDLIDRTPRGEGGGCVRVWGCVSLRVKGMMVVVCMYRRDHFDREE